MNQQKSLTVFIVLENSVGRSVTTVQNTAVKTTVKRLTFYGRTTERNPELYFVSYCRACGILNELVNEGSHVSPI